MTIQTHLRNQYAREAVTTASPARLVTMLYDRLLKDLHDAEVGLGAHNIQTTHNALTHAQDVIRELHSTLDTTAWKEGENLLRIYEWSLEELMAANVEKNAKHVVDVREVLEPLAEAWHQVSRVSNGESD